MAEPGIKYPLVDLLSMKTGEKEASAGGLPVTKDLTE